VTDSAGAFEIETDDQDLEISRWVCVLQNCGDVQFDLACFDTDETLLHETQPMTYLDDRVVAIELREPDFTPSANDWAELSRRMMDSQTVRLVRLAQELAALTPEYAALVSNVQTSSLPVSRRMDGWDFETYTCEKEFRESVTPASPYPLSKIETPVLVIMAEDDPISLPANVRALAEQMPNARLYAVPDGGHFLFGHAKEANIEIAQFLRRYMVEPERPADGKF